MENETGQHWTNKAMINKGTLRDFSEDYAKINGGEAQFATASQLFPTGNKTESENGTEAMEYEYIIYYKVNKNSLKYLNQKGQVETKKEEELVVM